jgi:Ser/Thr protein kinase RdoA (MazF antagonist)
MPSPDAAADRTHPYARLTPDRVLDALDAVGLRGDGRLLQLNSYENRVVQLHLEDGRVCVAKFYRPGRWSDAQILEEHAFALELAQAELPVVAPWALQPQAGATLHATVSSDPATLATLHDEVDASDAMRLAVYDRRAGHGPELENLDTLRWLGRFVGRLHAIGARGAFKHRRTLTSQAFGHDAVARVLAIDLIAPAELAAWRGTCQAALAQVDAAFAGLPGLRMLRLHGDFHPGNIMWRDEGPHVVDLDDCVTGPAVQDLWMLLSGGREAMRTQLAALLAGYREFMDFDARELALVEPLRTLRMIHHSAWIAERWADPAFPIAFPWFGTPSYWSQQTVQLREQLEAMGDEPLAL